MLLSQAARDGFAALLEPPGSYCAYACLYFTMCWVKIFNLATLTFEEQHRHIAGLHQLSMGMLRRGVSSVSFATLPFDYYTHDRVSGTDPAGAGGEAGSAGQVQGPTPASLAGGVADYEQFFDTAAELDDLPGGSNSVRIISCYQSVFSHMFLLSFQSLLMTFNYTIIEQNRISG